MAHPAFAEAAKKESSTPITMRLDERAIEQLKLKARRLSYETNKDLSYVDLIRKAITSEYKINLDNGTDLTSEEPRLIIPDEPRGFWTKKDITDFESSELGKKFVKAVETGLYYEVAAIWLEQWELWVRGRSVSHKLLRFYEKGKDDTYAEFTRDIAAVAFVVARRKACPNMIIEAERVIVPQFEIATNPDIALTELKPHILFSTMCACIKAWQKQLDTNTILALIAAADSVKSYPSQVIPAQRLEIGHLMLAVQNVARHQVAPAAIVVSETDYCMFHSFGRDFVSAPPLKVALETREYGSIWGIPIHVTGRIEDGTIIVCAAPENIGALIEFEAPRVIVTEGSNRKNVSILESGEVGLVIINDWAISVIKIKEE